MPTRVRVQKLFMGWILRSLLLRLAEALFAVLAGLGAEDLLDVVGHDDLLVDQQLGELRQAGPVVRQDLAGLLRHLVDQGLGLGVDQLGRLLAIGFVNS